MCSTRFALLCATAVILAGCLSTTATTESTSLVTDRDEERRTVDPQEPTVAPIATPRPTSTPWPEATAVPEPTPAAEATPESALNVTPPGWQTFDVGPYIAAVPQDWIVTTNASQINLAIDAVLAESGTDASEEEWSEWFRGLVDNGAPLFAFNELLDVFTVTRLPGSQADIADVEARTADAMVYFDSLGYIDPAVVVDVQTYGNVRGLLINASTQQATGEVANAYQFITVHGEFRYELSLNLVSGPDRRFADMLFGSFRFD